MQLINHLKNIPVNVAWITPFCSLLSTREKFVSPPADIFVAIRQRKCVLVLYHSPNIQNPEVFRHNFQRATIFFFFFTELMADVDTCADSDESRCSLSNIEDNLDENCTRKVHAQKQALKVENEYANVILYCTIMWYLYDDSCYL